MGLNSYGQLGDGSLEDKNDPVYVADDVVAFSAGRYAHSMFITSDGSLWGMGANDDGQLGDGTLQEQDVPVKILEHAKAVSCGAYHTIVMLDDGSFLAAGDNSSGQFGNSSTEGSSTFIPIDWGF
jgi:alpha-tubulin suppressor-like RCC1 family protein